MLRRRELWNKKGFTLVELIVVLVILSILGAAVIPAMTGSIDKAKEKKAVTEAQACVTAGTGLGAQLYSEARSTALQNVSASAEETNTAITNALKAWASDVTDKGPTLTGSLALTEGQGQYYLKPGNLQSGSAAGADKLKAAAGVDGTVEDFWCSGTGQIVYLRYLSADGILVAYTNNGTSGGAVVIPTPDVPEPDVPTESPSDKPTDKPTESPTTKPSPPSYSDGDLIFEIRDEYTDLPIDGTVDGIRFKLVKLTNDGSSIVKEIGSATIGSDGRIAFHVPIEELGYVEYWQLIAEDIPDGIQDILPVTVEISRQPQEHPTGFKVQQIQHNSNTESSDYSYKKGYVSKEVNAEYEHVCTFYVRRTPTVQFRVVDDLTGLDLPGVKFTVSNGSNSVSVSDSSKANTFYVKVHANDKLPTGIKASDCIDLSSSGSGELLYHVTFSKTPSDYHYFEAFPLTFYFISQNGSGHHPTVEYSPKRADHVLSTTVTCEHKDNNSIVTIHVSQYKNITFHSYSVDDLTQSSIPELAGAHLKLLKADSNNQYTIPVEEWDTTTDAKSIDLEPGAYCLKETTTPTNYKQPSNDVFFSLMQDNSGNLKLTGSSSSVDSTNSSVAMVHTPTVKMVWIRIADKNDTSILWKDASVRLQKNAIFSNDVDISWKSDLTDSGKLCALPLENGSYTVSISSDNNYTATKYSFRIQQDGDAFTIVGASDSNAGNGTVSGNVITIYAYTSVTFSYYWSYPVSQSNLKGAKLGITDTSGSFVATPSNGNNPWDIGSNSVSIPLSTGNYIYKEVQQPDDTTIKFTWDPTPHIIQVPTPVQFRVVCENGLPAVYKGTERLWSNPLSLAYTAS